MKEPDNTPNTSSIQEPAIIDAKHICKTYHLGSTTINALQEINMEIWRGEVVAIMGPSGCGKTTLLNCLSGLDDIDSGSLTIAGNNVRTMSDRQLTAFRARQMGFVFQTYNLLPVLNGLENVELPMLVSGVKPAEARKRALAAIEQVRLSAWAKHKPAEMSGGQRQRFTIARALATKPAIVWADEPTGALDSESSQEIIELMLALNRQNQQTFVWVTHAPEIGARAQRLITMRDGAIVEDRCVAQRSQPLTI